MATDFFTAVSVVPVKLLAYHVSMVCAANCRDSFIYIRDRKLS